MSMKQAAQIKTLEQEVAAMREQIAQASQKPHMLADLLKKFDEFGARITALEEEVKPKKRAGKD